MGPLMNEGWGLRERKSSEVKTCGVHRAEVNSSQL